MKKDSFVLYTEYIEQIELLSMEQRGILLTAIFAYVSDAELPDMDGITKMAFAFIKSRIDKDTEKYAKTIEKRKEAAVLSAVDWKVVVSASILSGILSVANSVAGIPEVEEK